MPESAGPGPDQQQHGVSRRGALVGGAAAVAAWLVVPGSARPASAGPRPLARSRLGFAPVPPVADTMTVPAGYRIQTLAAWGQPLRTGGPAWRGDGGNSSAQQAQQVGMQHSGLQFHPLGEGPQRGRHGLLVINHESVDPALLYPDPAERMSPERVAKALAAQGVSVVEIREAGGTWRIVDSPRNVRLTGAMPAAFSGPVRAEHPALGTVHPALGTLSNSSLGGTPWGTYLTCEKDFQSWFGTRDQGWRPGEAELRYGLSAFGHGYRWHEADPRFDLAVSPNEPHRFGWVVELTLSLDGSPAKPVKRTALGRFAHAGATVTESRGRVVVYSADDEDGGYLYKFVGTDTWQRDRATGRSPLDHGTLYVARFAEGGSGQWLPLTHTADPLIVENGWRDQADILLSTRLAADALGATPLDHPQQVAIDPRDGRLYCAMASGAGDPNCRVSPGVDRPGSVSPRSPNPYGHIVRWREGGDDATATTFSWDVFLLAGDPGRDSRVRLDVGGMFSSPKGLHFGPDGRLWIHTGLERHQQDHPGPTHVDLRDNAVLVADPRTGETGRFLTCPRGTEITGVVIAPDQRTMFVNLRQTGPGAAGPDLARSAGDPARSTTAVIRRSDGGPIGAV